MTLERLKMAKPLETDVFVSYYVPQMLFITGLRLRWGPSCAIFSPLIFIPKYLNFSTKNISKQRVYKMIESKVIAHAITVRANVSCHWHAILLFCRRC